MFRPTLELTIKQFFNLMVISSEIESIVFLFDNCIQITKKFILIDYCFCMIASEITGANYRKSSIEKYIFNCEAYRKEGNAWIRLEKMFIDNQFDSKNNKGISKVKVKGERGFESTYMVKITFNQKDFYYSMTQELQLHWLVHIIEVKVAEAVPTPPTFNEYINVCAGTIYKKSGFLGDWEKCFVMITQEGLTAAKDEKSKPDLQITQATQLWTRFQLIQKNAFFVFKLRDFFKYEFGAPVESVSKWTKAFYSLIHFD